MPWYDRLISRELSDVDYPEAAAFIQARNRRRSGNRQIRYIVIHITGGPAMDERSAINQFLSGPSSAHYIVNRAGEIIQMVRESEIANHINNINSRQNLESIGIEHVNPWNSTMRVHPTLAQYRASANLVNFLCGRYGIAMTHTPTPHTPGIKGHIEAEPSSGHTTCPNPAWDWPRYITMVRNSDASLDRWISRVSAGGAV